MPKVLIKPDFGGEDMGDGGVRRVVEAQRRYLPEFGWELTDNAEEADLITAHILLDSETAKVVRRNRVPYVAQVHGLYWADYDRWPNWALKANHGVIESARLADIVTAPSEWVARAMRRGLAADIRVVYHGVDLPEWEPDPERLDFALWNKTRVDPVCDPHPVEQAAELLPGITFVSTFARGAQPPGNMRITGRLGFEAAKAIIRKAGVYLATSRETFGIGTLEAMAAGVPVAGFAWGGQVEIITPGVDGILVPPGDVTALAQAIEEVLGKREAMGKAARETVEARFQWRDAVGRTAAVFDEALAGWQARHAGPRTSVVITNYRLPEYLPRAVESVLAQTDPDFEVVIVDDASNDEGRSAEVIAEMQARDPRVRAVMRAKNGYLAAARNSGIEAARGRYIFPLDADDEIAPRTLELLAGALDNERGIAIAYGGADFFEESDGSRIPSNWPGDFDWRGQMSKRNQLPYSSMFRREVWERTAGYRTRCRTAEDADFWCRVSSYGFRPVKVTTEPTLIYHNRSDSMSHSVKLPDYTRWFPWSRDPATTPFGAVGEPVNPEVQAWPVATYEFPRITVIVPVGPGHEGYVLDALDSVDAQTYRNWEVIVVNDTGGALPRLPGWARVINSAEDKAGNPVKSGVARARNRAIAEARAPLVFFLDADDYLQPECLERLLTVYRDREGYAVVYCDQWTVRGEHIEAAEAYDWDPASTLLAKAVHGNPALYEKAALVDVGGFDEALRAWEDWDLQLALAAKGYCSIRLPVPLWSYRLEAGSRREALLAEKEANVRQIVSKYEPYFTGGKPLMACSSCGGRGATVAMAPMSLSREAKRMQLPPGDLIEVRYTGGSLGGISFRGIATGQLYMFSAEENERVRFVRRDDADPETGGLLSKADFVLNTPTEGLLAPSAEPELVAAGPPAREEPSTTVQAVNAMLGASTPAPAAIAVVDRPEELAAHITEAPSEWDTPRAPAPAAAAPAAAVLPEPEPEPRVAPVTMNPAKRKPGRPRRSA